MESVVNVLKEKYYKVIESLINNKKSTNMKKPW